MLLRPFGPHECGPIRAIRKGATGRLKLALLKAAAYLSTAMKFVVTLAVLALAHGALACGHGDADGERRLTQLRDELARVQADRDRVDQRLVALETQPAGAAAAAAAKSVESKSAAANGSLPQPRLEKASAVAMETPKLRVIRLGPDGSSPIESTSAEETASSIDDDGSARAMIRVTGRGSSSRGRGRAPQGGSQRADVIVETLPPEEASAQLPSASAAAGAPIRERAPRPSALDPDARRAYDDAYALVQAKKCQQALDAFAGFIVRWPDHPNADNALYWRGECYAQLGDLPRAIEQFEGTIARFPLGNKVPDALLKLGISNTKLGNQARAQEAFGRLEREYPRSEARRRIPQGAGNKP